MHATRGARSIYRHIRANMRARAPTAQHEKGNIHHAIYGARAAYQARTIGSSHAGCEDDSRRNSHAASRGAHTCTASALPTLPVTGLERAVTIARFRETIPNSEYSETLGRRLLIV